MDAKAYGQTAYRCNNDLRTGQVYVFKYVGFQPTDMPTYMRPASGLTIPNEYYLVMHNRTEFRAAEQSVYIPTLPSTFLSFNVVATLRNRMRTGLYICFLFIFY